MKIVEICISRGWGGLEIYSGNLSMDLAKRGHEVILCLQEDSRLQEFVRKKMPELRTVVFGSGGILSVNTIMKLRKLCREFGPEVIHSHVSSNLWPVRFAALGLNPLPKIFFTDHMGTSFPKRDLLHRWLHRAVTRGIATTDRGKKIMAGATTLPEEKIAILPYGIDEKCFAAEQPSKIKARKIFGLPKNGFIAGQISRIDSKKGQKEFLEAAETVLRENPGEVFFVIAGGVQPGDNPGFQEELSAFIKNRALQDRVFFLGHRENVPLLLKTLDLFVFPTHEEAFGLVTIEAQMSGLPVIATEAGGIPEIITDGETGLLVPPKDSQALAGAILKLLSDSGLRNRIATAGKKNALDKYSLEKHLSGMENIYSLGDIP